MDCKQQQSPLAGGFVQPETAVRHVTALEWKATEAGDLVTGCKWGNSKGPPVVGGPWILSLHREQLIIR